MEKGKEFLCLCKAEKGKFMWKTQKRTWEPVRYP